MRCGSRKNSLFFLKTKVALPLLLIHLNTKVGVSEEFLSCPTLDEFFLTQIGGDILGELDTDNFGGDVSLSQTGDILAVGANNNDGNGDASGHVRVYKRDGNQWNQRGSDIDGEHANTHSGPHALSGDGNIIAISAPFNSDNGFRAGHVRVFKFDTVDWVQIGSDIDGLEEGANFGEGLAISADGNILAVSAKGQGENTEGQVRVFQWDAIIQDWVQLGREINGEGDLARLSEVSLSQDGSILAISEPWNSIAGTYAGRVRIFQLSNGDWEQIGLDLLGKSGGDRFGISLSLSTNGRILAVGADWSNNRSGTVTTYTFQDNDWVQLGRVLLGEASGDDFGNAVALSGEGNILVVGAPYNSANGDSSGLVRVFYYQNDWIQIFDDIDGQLSGQELGKSVAMSTDGTTFATGGPALLRFDGIVKVFQIECKSSGQSTEPAPVPSIDGAPTPTPSLEFVSTTSPLLNPTQPTVNPSTPTAPSVLIPTISPQISQPSSSPQTSSVPANSSTKASTSSSSKGGLIGGVVVAVVFIILIVGVLSYYLFKQRQSLSQETSKGSNNHATSNTDQIQSRPITESPNYIEASGPDFKGQTKSMTRPVVHQESRKTPEVVTPQEPFGVLMGEELPDYKAQVRSDPVVAIAEAIPFDP